MLDPFSVIEEDAETPDFDTETIQRGDSETFWAFLAAVILAQVGLFAASLGAMLYWFRGQETLGGALAVGGLVALAITVAITVWHRRRD